VALQLNVTRHPYSFIGDARGPSGPGGLSGVGNGNKPTETWHDALLGYMGGDPTRRDAAEAGMREQGKAAGIEFDYNVLAQWQPIDSQRLLLWAGRFGLQEEFMSALNKRHFELRESASLRSTLIAAAEEVGLDTQDASAFLDTDELSEVVWKSYGDTIHKKNIHSIPLFAFSVDAIGAVGGPFRAPGKHEAYVVRGSMDDRHFLSLFELIARDVKAGRRIFDEASSAFRQDEWWRPTVQEGTCATGLAGKRVTLQGLRKRPELNGRTGRVRDFSHSKGRWQVEVDGESGALLLRPENLALADGTCG